MVKTWLDKHGVEYTERDMNAFPPSAEELLQWSDKGKIRLRQFLRPRRFSLKLLLLNNQMTLVEREMQAFIIAGAKEHVACPMMVGDDFVVIGIDNAQWRKALNILS